MKRREFAITTITAAIGGAMLSHPVFGVAAAPPASNEIPLSVMLWTILPKAAFDERVEKVKEAGYHKVELVREYDGWDKQRFAEARKKLRSLDLTVDACSGISTSLCDPSQREAFLKEVEAKLPVLDELETKRLILLSGNVVPNLSHEQMHESCVEGLKRAADIVSRKNVILLFENIDPQENPKYFLTSSREGLEMVRAMKNPNVRFLYDLYHEQIAEGNLIDKLVKFKDEIATVHIADVPGRHIPGTGEINYANVYRKLGEIGYSDVVAMEFLPTGDPVQELTTARTFFNEQVAAGRGRTSSNSNARAHATA